MAEEQKETRTLAELGVGDQVAILSGNNSPRIDKIKAISRGFIALEGTEDRYRQSNGYQYWPKGTQPRFYSSSQIVPVTEEVVLKMRHATLVQRLGPLHWKVWEKISLATLEGIVALIDADPSTKTEKKGDTI